MATTARVRTALPLELHWHSLDRPLPLRAVRPVTGRPHSLGLEAPPWHGTGPVDQPFDFCGHIRRLCADIALHTPELRHVDARRLLICITQARGPRPHGLQARVTPLRFAGGQPFRVRRGITYQVQRFVVERVEMLYLVAFCLPRFLDQSFEDKFITLFHELYHIGPAFDGDLRRHGGRYDLHSHSKRAYDRYMAQLTRAYLSNGADKSLHGFLRLNFAQLCHRHGSVVGAVVPRPRLIPLTPLAADATPSIRDASEKHR